MTVWRTILSDTFDRADGVIGSPEVDLIGYGAWADQLGGTGYLPTIVSNHAVDPTDSQRFLYVPDGIPADMRVTITTEAGKYSAFALRTNSDATDTVVVQVNTTSVSVFDTVDSVNGTATTSNISVSAGVAASFVITAQGPTVTVTGDLVATITHTSAITDAGGFIVSIIDGDAEASINSLAVAEELTAHELDATSLPQYMLHAFPDGEDAVATIIPHVAVESFEHRRNAPGEARVTFSHGTSFLDALVNADGEWETGVRCWIVRDGQIVWRGFTDGYDDDLGTGTVRIRLMDDLEHYARQLAGDAERTNYAPDFQEDTWTEAGDATSTTDATDAYTADENDALAVSGGTAGGYVSHVYPVDDSSADNQQVYHVSVWMLVEPGDEWPFTITAQARWDGGGPGKFVNGRATWDEYDAAATGRLVRLEVEPLTVPAAETDVEVVVYLHARPGCTVYYSALQIARNNNTGVGKGGDVGTLVGTLLQYGIDADPDHLPISRASQLTGTTLGEGMIYPHAEHPELWGAISDWFHELDVRINHTAGRVESGPSIGRTFRHLQVGPIDDGGHYGGAVQPSSVAGRDRSTQVIALGAARDSVTRDERGAEGAGPRWMSVVSAPDGTIPRDLTAIAAAELDQLQNPGGVISVALRTPYGHRTPGDWLRFGLTACDKFYARVDAGPASVAGLMVVDRLMVMPTDGDRCVVDLVRA